MTGFRKVNTGDSLVIPADDYNAAMDAAKDFARRRSSNGFESSDSPLNPAVLSMLNNGDDVTAPGGVLGIDGPLFTSDDNLNGFQYNLKLQGSTPATASHTGKFAITSGLIAADSIGEVIVSSIAVCQVLMNNSTDTYADIADGQQGYLSSGSSGAAQILWTAAPGGSGSAVWAVVRLSPPAPIAIQLGKANYAIPTGSQNYVEIWTGPPGGESDSGNSVQAWNWFGPVAAGQWVLIASINGGYYVLPLGGMANKAMFLNNTANSTASPADQGSGGLTIPAGAVMQITGSAMVAGQEVLQAQQFTTSCAGSYPPAPLFAINDSSPIAPGAVGTCFYGGYYDDWPVRALYDDTETVGGVSGGTPYPPAVGERWGAIAGSWKLARDMPGFEIVGNVQDTTGSVSGGTATVTVRPRAENGLCWIHAGADTPGYAALLNSNEVAGDFNGAVYFWNTGQPTYTSNGDRDNATATAFPGGELRGSRGIIQNSRMAIPEGGWGLGFYLPPFRFIADLTTFGSPAPGGGNTGAVNFGQDWGPFTGSYKLGFNKGGGFRLVGETFCPGFPNTFVPAPPRPGFLFASWNVTLYTDSPLGSPLATATANNIFPSATSLGDAGYYLADTGLPAGQDGPSGQIFTRVSGDYGSDNAFQFLRGGIFAVTLSAQITGFADQTGGPSLVPLTTYGMPTTNLSPSPNSAAAVVTAFGQIALKLNVAAANIPFVGAYIYSQSLVPALVVKATKETSFVAVYGNESVTGLIVANAGDVIELLGFCYQYQPDSYVIYSTGTNMVAAVQLTVAQIGGSEC